MNRSTSWYVQKGENALKTRDEIYDGWKMDSERRHYYQVLDLSSKFRWVSSSLLLQPDFSCRSCHGVGRMHSGQTVFVCIEIILLLWSCTYWTCRCLSYSVGVANYLLQTRCLSYSVAVITIARMSTCLVLGPEAVLECSICRCVVVYKYLGLL